MQRLHLVRHTEVENPGHLVYGGLPGFGLSLRGLTQAEQVAAHLATRDVASIWCSPLQRAWETAEQIVARFHLPVFVDEDLTEWRLSDGWAGIIWEELDFQRPGELTAYLTDPATLPFSPESLDECAKRMAGVVERLQRQNVDGEVVVVSHQDPIQAVRLLLTGRPLSEQHTDKPGLGSILTLLPGSPWKEIERWDPAEVTPGFPPSNTIE